MLQFLRIPEHGGHTMTNADQEHLVRLREQIAAAIRQIRAEIRWKPGKDVEHLRTRIHYGHLPPDATLDDYEEIIATILHDPDATVFAFIWKNDVYPTIVAKYRGRQWLVMFSLSGVMETAFPPTDPDEYLADPRFQYVGAVQELLP